MDKELLHSMSSVATALCYISWCLSSLFFSTEKWLRDFFILIGALFFMAAAFTSCSTPKKEIAIEISDCIHVARIDYEKSKPMIDYIFGHCYENMYVEKSETDKLIEEWVE